MLPSASVSAARLVARNVASPLSLVALDLEPVEPLPCERRLAAQPLHVLRYQLGS